MQAEVGQGLISVPPDRQYHGGEPYDPGQGESECGHTHHFRFGNVLFSFEVLENLAWSLVHAEQTDSHKATPSPFEFSEMDYVKPQ